MTTRTISAAHLNASYLVNAGNNAVAMFTGTQTAQVKLYLSGNPVPCEVADAIDLFVAEHVKARFGRTIESYAPEPKHLAEIKTADTLPRQTGFDVAHPSGVMFTSRGIHGSMGDGKTKIIQDALGEIVVPPDTTYAFNGIDPTSSDDFLHLTQQRINEGEAIQSIAIYTDCEFLVVYLVWRSGLYQMIGEACDGRPAKVWSDQIRHLTEPDIISRNVVSTVDLLNGISSESDHAEAIYLA